MVSQSGIFWNISYYFFAEAVVLVKHYQAFLAALDADDSIFQPFYQLGIGDIQSVGPEDCRVG